MKNEKFIKPLIEVIEIDNDSIICTSNSDNWETPDIEYD